MKLQNLWMKAFPYAKMLGIVLLVAGVVLVLGWLFSHLFGCAIAQSPDGSFVVGSRFSGDGATASGLGGAIGGVASLFMGPGGAIVGTLATGLLAAVGYGAKKSGDAKAATQSAAASDKAWDEAAAYHAAVYAAPPPAPLVRGQPMVAASGLPFTVVDPVVAAAPEVT